MSKGLEMRLKEIERNNWWGAAVLTGTAGLWSTPHFTLSVLAGGLVMALNFYLWRVLVGSMLRSQWDRKVPLGGVILKIMAKFFVLMGVTAILFLCLGIHPMGFILGSTNLLVSTVLSGIKGSKPGQVSSCLDVRSRQG